MQISYHNVSETTVGKGGGQLLIISLLNATYKRMWCVKSEGCGRSPAAICNFLHACTIAPAAWQDLSVREKPYQPAASCALTQMGVAIPRVQWRRWAVLVEDFGTADVCSAYCKPSTRRAGLLSVAYWKVAATPAPKSDRMGVGAHPQGKQRQGSVFQRMPPSLHRTCDHMAASREYASAALVEQ